MSLFQHASPTESQGWIVTGTTLLAGLVAGGVWWFTHHTSARRPHMPAHGSAPSPEASAEQAAAVQRHPSGADAQPYETLTRDELYQIARERDIYGRSSMKKDELLEAVRASDA